MHGNAWTVVGAPFGLASCRQETSQGPRTYRAAHIVQRLRATGADVQDGFDLAPLAPPSEPGDLRLKFLSQVTTFAGALEERIRSDVYAAGRRPILVGGDHSISIGSVAAGSNYLKQQGGANADLGLLWVDAHADLNTHETTPSGNIHGMSVAALLGIGDRRLCAIGGEAPKIKPANVVYLGLRDLDPPERTLLREKGITFFTMKDVDTHGMAAIARAALARLSARTRGFIASFDMDVCDPHIAPGVGTPVRGGLSFREAHLIMEMISETPGLLSIEIVEFNPAKDIDGSTCEMGIALLESALGKSII